MVVPPRRTHHVPEPKGDSSEHTPCLNKGVVNPPAVQNEFYFNLENESRYLWHHISCILTDKRSESEQYKDDFSCCLLDLKAFEVKFELI